MAQRTVNNARALWRRAVKRNLADLVWLPHMPHTGRLLSTTCMHHAVCQRDHIICSQLRLPDSRP